MKMGKIEKLFVNSRRHAKGNIRVTERLFLNFDLRGIGSALEIGCGVGMLSDYLSKNYDMNVTGTDVDVEQIGIAKKNFRDNDRLSFSVATATNLPFDNSTFDMVLSFKVLHHISDWETVLKEVNRVLKPKGILVFSDFCCTSFLKRIFGTFGKNYGVYTLNDLIECLAGLDMKAIHQEKSKPFIFVSQNVLFQKGFA
ncbi:MAG: class I SAM-dependent methyltransferase [Deltaproteobacteria bacterium]|nr:class I SAM-dependent methyltransferase [Deltaproteobacteria bacterium]MBW2065648.1 class I SAM-dependent methyltransferase [Deltaproteobacteria bacterium]